MEAFATWSLLIYALLVLGGGVMGYTRRGSKPSLIAGSVCGVILLISFFAALGGSAVTGLVLGLVVALLLLVVFALRYRHTRRMMPAGLMAILSFAAAVIYLLGLLGG